jgi:starvation-inducible DNA-binding protein
MVMEVDCMAVGVPERLATPSDLDQDARSAVADALNPLVADAFALYLKTKNYHWHVSGPHFRDYHLLLDEQGDQILAITDVLAERCRKLGQPTLHSIGEVSRLQRVTDDDRADVPPTEMLRSLMEDNQGLATHMRRAHQVCNEAGDVATASLLETFIDEAERRIWFLYEATKM